MKTQAYARLENNTVIEVIELADNIKLTDIYRTDIAQGFIKAPADIAHDIAQGWQLTDDGKWQQPTVTAPPSLDALKATLKQQIDEAAERERLKYITPGVGQSMTYQEKFNQAVAYSRAHAAHLTDPEHTTQPNQAEYLLLASGLGIDGDTLSEIAATVTFAYAQWQQIGAAIETIRLQAKAGIDKAKTIKTAQAIVDKLTWPQP